MLNATLTTFEWIATGNYITTAVIGILGLVLTLLSWLTVKGKKSQKQLEQRVECLVQQVVTLQEGPIYNLGAAVLQLKEEIDRNHPQKSIVTGIKRNGQEAVIQRIKSMLGQLDEMEAARERAEMEQNMFQNRQESTFIL